MIMMMLKVDPRAEQGARMWNRDRLRKRVSFVVVFLVLNCCRSVDVRDEEKSKSR